MPGNKKTEALMKTFTKESVAVIHTPMRGEKGGPKTVAMVEVDKTLSDRMKMEEAFVKTNSINDAWWNNEGVTPMFPDKPSPFRTQGIRGKTSESTCGRNWAPRLKSLGTPGTLGHT